jgi:hypothetical protein
MNDDNLSCHYCGVLKPNPKLCPKCGSKNIKYFGMGTQKLEKEFQKKFCINNTLRMDADTTRFKNAHQKILDVFRSGKSKVLLGTDALVILEHVSAAEPGCFGRVCGHQAEWRGSRVESIDILAVQPEVVVRREDGKTEHDERSSSDQQRPHPARVNRRKECQFVELSPFHIDSGL